MNARPSEPLQVPDHLWLTTEAADALGDQDSTLVLIEDEAWWGEFGGYIETDWESDGLHRYSSLDRQALINLTQDPNWSNEGLFAFLEGLRRFEAVGKNAPSTYQESSWGYNGKRMARRQCCRRHL
ncbi:hypothetical protein [Polymorphospora rubra]|uniref:hypothetical protein n=1 Tax=Polymorphospora rubra TaxID=338584 RepID=UPI0033DFFFFF